MRFKGSMDQGQAKASASANGSSDGGRAWEGRELEQGNNIWATNEQDTASPHQSCPPSPQQPPSITRARAGSVDSFEDISIADAELDGTSPTDSDHEFELIECKEYYIHHSHRRNRRLSLTSRFRVSTVSGLLLEGEEGASDSNAQGKSAWLPATSKMDGGGSSKDYGDSDWQQAGHNADPQDLAGPGAYGFLLCSVEKPQKEGEGTQNPYISYLVNTDTDFKSFQTSHSSVRRRFADFTFLYKNLQKEYPQCAVPPLPDKHNMSYVRGDRFGQDFTARRAHSLDRFLKRLTLHPVLRRAVILTLFLESSDWNATMKSRPQRMSTSEGTSGSVLETWTDTVLNAFTKPHKTDKRFADVNARASKLNEDLGTVSKTVARVAKREQDLETDYADLSAQFQRLAALEPGVADELNKFAASVQDTSEGWRELKEHTDQDYLGSLKDMESYILSIKALLKTREQKQLDFEGLTEYLNKAAYERDTLASHGNLTGSTTGFLRQKLEDVRGVDHEQSRRERQRKLEVQISRLQTEVESSKKMSEAFDEEVVKEVQDFERIKAAEFRETLGGLADAHIGFFRGNVEIWERFVKEMEEMQGEGEGGGRR